MKYRIAKLEALERSGRRPPGYVDAYKRAAYKADGDWLWVTDEHQRRLIARYRPAQLAGYDVDQERRRMRQGGCCGHWVSDQ
jgi:hypothetical protein